ncbi:Uncharacterised protein [uncultured archaeon]|nr:Uncharacterised protein [uncultured archaeon]
MAKKETRNEKKKSPGGLFVPAGVLIGLGLGFLMNNVTAYLFLGLGAGFLVWAIYEIARKK